jgi:hypothetical protein
MSDRRFLVAVIGTLTAALGAAIVLLALLGLRHPVGSSGDLGTPTDLGFLLTNLIWFGVLLIVTGAGTAITLVRAQQRRRTHPESR